MALPDLFACDDYKIYLKDTISANMAEVGYKTKLAKAARCQKSYLSQVLNGDVHLTIDHAANIATFLGLGDNDTDHFIDLVMLARSGTEALTSTINRRINERKAQKRTIGNRITDTQEVADKYRAEFYSQWFYSAIYMLCGVHHDLKSIADRLRLDRPLVEHVLGRLQEMGLIDFGGGRYQKTKRNLFLRDTPYRYAYRSSWRQKGILAQQTQNPETDMFFSTLWTLRMEDAERIRRELLNSIEIGQKIAVESEEDELFCFNLDFFVV